MTPGEVAADMDTDRAAAKGFCKSGYWGEDVLPCRLWPGLSVDVGVELDAGNDMASGEGELGEKGPDTERARE